MSAALTAKQIGLAKLGDVLTHGMHNVISLYMRPALGVVLCALSLLQACASEPDNRKIKDATSTGGAAYIPPNIPGYPSSGEECSVYADEYRDAALDESTSLGFSGRDVVALFNDTAHGELRWTDGETTSITFHAKASQSRVSYREAPKDEGACTPTLEVTLDEIAIESNDHMLDAHVNGPREDPPKLAAVSDGRGGIALLFPIAFRVDPDAVHSDLIKDAEQAHPDHDDRFIAPEFTVSAHNAKAHCLPGDVVSDDPNEACNIYDGVLRYNSSELSKVHSEPVPEDASYKQAIATWHWAE